MLSGVTDSPAILQTLERERRCITGPGLLEAPGGVLRRGLVVLCLLGVHETVQGPAIVRELLQALNEGLLRLGCLTGLEQGCPQRLTYRVIPVGRLHVRDGVLDAY